MPVATQVVAPELVAHDEEGIADGHDRFAALQSPV